MKRRRVPDAEGKLLCHYCRQRRPHQNFARSGAYWQYKCDECARALSFERQFYRRWQQKGTTAMVADIQEAERVNTRRKDLLHKIVFEGYRLGRRPKP